MTYPLRIGDVQRTLRVCAVNDETSIAFLDVLGDVELLDAFATAVSEKLSDVDVLLCGDTVGLVIGHHLSVRLGIPYVAARKRRTPDMVDEPLVESVRSIAASQPANFYLAADKARQLHQQRVCVVDEVTSTGSTVAALTSLALRSGCASTKTVVIATEGTADPAVIAVAHLPLF
jgi:adenine phosphoribosyltransferase